MLGYYIHIKYHLRVLQQKPKAFVDRAGVSCIEVKSRCISNAWIQSM
jgi:hypothetical protein